jgi:hypothetical protein
MADRGSHPLQCVLIAGDRRCGKKTRDSAHRSFLYCRCCRYSAATVKKRLPPTVVDCNIKLPLRSFNEIAFRLRQELVNFILFMSPPHLPAAALETTPAHSPALPDPVNVAARLKTAPFAAKCLLIAEEILQQRFPLLGYTLQTGPEIHWRRDYASGLETGTSYFRRIPYLDAAQAGDHKTIWELNRHQHLVLLAQAHLLSGDNRFLEQIVSQLESWFAQNPFQRGINWSSALEVAFRSLSWIWIYRLVGDRLADPFRSRFLEELYRHGRHLEDNLSYYFSPNTHLLGEAVALHALGVLFPYFPRANRWEKTGARIVRNELDRQVLADGCHFELSTYYHVYALDMFLFHAVIRGPDDFYRDKLTLMASFLDNLIGSSGVLPFLGDDDGGRFFHPYGTRNQFALATLATCGQFLGRPEWIRDPRYFEEQAVWWIRAGQAGWSRPLTCQRDSLRFRDSGLIVMTAGDIQLVADTGGFGPGNAGHSHADTLSLVLRQGTEQILIDPGTFTYVADPAWRERFRGTSAHNTVRINGIDQAIPRGPFAWQSRPEVEVLAWDSSPTRDMLTAACLYAGLRHQRKIVFCKSGLWIVIQDLLEGGPGEHRIEQFWHFGTAVRQSLPQCFQAGAKTLVAFEVLAEPRLMEGGDIGWISPALGEKIPAPVVCVEQRATLPTALTTLIDLSGKARTLRFHVHPDQAGADCVYDEERMVSLVWT